MSKLEWMLEFDAGIGLLSGCFRVQSDSELGTKMLPRRAGRCGGLERDMMETRRGVRVEGISCGAYVDDQRT
jgi:hypothetical protein